MFFILLLFWLIFNGRFTLEILLFGIVICGLLYTFLCCFMGYSPKKDLKAATHIFRALLYVLMLLVEIIKANCVVIKFIYDQKNEPEPVIVHFKKAFKNYFHNEVLGNSITLTPGTITVELDDDEYTVHCLDKDLAADLDSSVFVKQLEKIEKVNTEKLIKKAGRDKK